ncbi:unnamed protein product [Mycena citricolor]|uniref:Uncharacterized protein n=1 Tax=Mycena citricolor TaxID=2018698 RepID=A0AAD2H427_9AGAR|nr:unnamed protein product [Mycena citricolor]CAK5270125.1 unnamed protein product [Mycena citricolor]
MMNIAACRIRPSPEENPVHPSIMLAPKSSSAPPHQVHIDPISILGTTADTIVQ